jgi:hypothetical protein
MPGMVTDHCPSAFSSFPPDHTPFAQTPETNFASFEIQGLIAANRESTHR